MLHTQIQCLVWDDISISTGTNAHRWKVRKLDKSVQHTNESEHRIGWQNTQGNNLYSCYNVVSHQTTHICYVCNLFPCHAFQIMFLIEKIFKQIVSLNYVHTCTLVLCGVCVLNYHPLTSVKLNHRPRGKYASTDVTFCYHVCVSREDNTVSLVRPNYIDCKHTSVSTGDMRRELPHINWVSRSHVLLSVGNLKVEEGNRGKGT